MSATALDPGAAIAAAVTELYDELRKLVDRGPTDDPGLLDELGRLTGRIRSRITRARKRAATSVAQKATQTSVQENRTQTVTDVTVAGQHPATTAEPASMVENTTQVAAAKTAPPDATSGSPRHPAPQAVGDGGASRRREAVATSDDRSQAHRSVPAAVPPASPRVTVPITSGPEPGAGRDTEHLFAGSGKKVARSVALLPRWVLALVFVLAVVVSGVVSATGGSLLVLGGGVAGVVAVAAGLVVARARRRGQR